jgi:hypothetical protein
MFRESILGLILSLFVSFSFVLLLGGFLFFELGAGAEGNGHGHAWLV